ARASYAGRLGSDELAGRLTASLPDLARFADLAGLPLRGAAELTADLEGTPRANRINAVLDARATALATGLAPVDGLTSGRLMLAGAVRRAATGDLTAENLRLVGEGGSARLDGVLAQTDGTLRYEAVIPELRRLDPRLAGRATLAGEVTGGLAHPNVTARALVSDATAIGRPVPRLALDVTASDVTGALAARASLDGVVDGRPARGTLQASRPAAGGFRLDALDLRVGRNAIRGEVAVSDATLATGTLALEAVDLAELSALTLTPLQGAVRADIALSAPDGGQDARVRADARQVVAGGITLERFEADLSGRDLLRRPVIEGRAAVDALAVGGETVSRLRLDAKGNPAGSDVVLTATARGFALDAAARVVPAARTRVELTQFGATRDGRRIGIVAPAAFMLVDGGVAIEGLEVGLGSGRLAVSGTAGSRLALNAAARAVPLAALDVLLPGLGLAGTLDGEARIAGTPTAPTGEYRTSVKGLSAPQARSANLPPADVAAAGRLGDGRAGLDATVAAGRAGTLRITGTVPAGGAGALDIAIRGQLDAAALTNGTLAPGGRQLAGRIDLDTRLGGPLAAPEASGSAALSGGTFTDAGIGLRLDAVQARLLAQGRTITIERAGATTRNGGTLSASGEVAIDPQAGFPGTIRIQGRKAELVRQALGIAVADLDLTLSGPLARMPRVAGRVDLVQTAVAVPEKLGGAGKPLPGTRHVRPDAAARARLALDRRSKKAGPPFDAALDLVVNAAGPITVRGRGLDALLGGNLRLTGTLAKPIPNGAFALQRGQLQILTSRLDFTRGRLTFVGSLVPELDFLAQTFAAGAQIQVAVTGPSSAPSFAFTSNPDLPQEEVLSRLLFGAPAGNLSGFQALALVQAAAQFAADDNAAFENLRRSLGVSSLDLSLGANGPG
ncbi:MAG: translocation/assembly module TamB domain-containing protein, partial [Methylobacteriaceae bacterium]|nr:translocation/assembly module TamB domain-containing protein [Methylobacteriaceae bacterium]